MIASLVWLWLSAFQIESSLVCPAPLEVSARLASLLPAEVILRTHAIARVQASPSGIRVELLRADGSLIGSRALPQSARPPSAEECADLAETAAVLIATWMSPDAPAPSPVPIAPVPAVAPTVRAFELSAAGGLSFAGDTVRPSGEFSALGLGRANIGASLGLTVDGRRDVPLASGRVSWQRPALHLGLVGRRGFSALTLDGTIGVLAGLLSVRGEGFDEGREADKVRWGAELAGRISLRPDRSLRPFLGVAGALWPGRVEAYQDPDGQAVALPTLALRVCLGLAFSR